MDSYKIRMIDEYRELKYKYQKLHKILVKIEAGTSDFIPTCPVDILKEQKSIMRKYLNILEIRAEIEGIGYDRLQSDPVEMDSNNR